MTELKPAKAVRNMTESDWNEMSKRLEATPVRHDDFKRNDDDGGQLKTRIRAFDNPSSDETLRVVVD